MEPPIKSRGVIKRDQVRLEESQNDARPASQVKRAREAGPRVRLVELDEHTRAFEFTCTCGEVSLIEIQHARES